MEEGYARLNLGVTNCFLLPCHNGPAGEGPAKKYLLIDTGYAKDYLSFLNLLKKNNIAPRQISYLLLTHYHNDHAGFAHSLQAEFGIPIIAHKNEISYLQKGDGTVCADYVPPNKRAKAFVKLFSLIQKDLSYPPVNCDENNIIIRGDDYDFLPSIGIKGCLLHTPGHSPGSLTVLVNDNETDKGLTFCGDLANNFLHFIGLQHRPLFISSHEEIFSSWKKVIDHGAKRILPAHGTPFSAAKLKASLSKIAL